RPLSPVRRPPGPPPFPSTTLFRSIKSITRDDERLVIKGKVMGAMTTTILVNPEDCWQAARLLGIGLILRLPLILLKGWLAARRRSEEHTSELQSRENLVCRLLLEK